MRLNFRNLNVSLILAMGPISLCGWLLVGRPSYGAHIAPTSISPCVPPVPHIAWKSPYAGFSRGISTDPRYFPIAVWLQGSMHAVEMARMGINIYVGNNAGTDPLDGRDLHILERNGISAIVGQDVAGLPNIENSAIAGWWMHPDEPDNAQENLIGFGRPVDPSVVMAEYKAFKAADSTRPTYLGLGQGVAYDNWEGRGRNPPAEWRYVPAGDIVGFDIYPYNACGRDANERAICGQFWLNAVGVERLHQWSNHNQAVWTWVETTDMNQKHGPTPRQTASEVWLALIHGANGIGYFVDVFSPSFREDGIFSDLSMVRAVTAMNRQIRNLAPELNSASIYNLVATSSSNPHVPIDTMVKANGSSIYIFAAVSRLGTTDGSFMINGMTGNGRADVLGEDRTVEIIAGNYQDSFAVNAIHIYKIDLSAASCK